MEILWAIVTGFFVGLLARVLLPGKDPGGLFITILLGIAGAVIATLLGRSMGWYAADQNAGFIASVVGSVLVLLIYRMFRRGTPQRI